MPATRPRARMSEQESGQFKPAVDLAGQIAESQTADIDKMRGLLDS